MTTPNATVTFRPGALFIPNKGEGDAGRFHPCKCDADGVPIPGTMANETILDEDGEVVWELQSYDKGWKAAKAALFIFLDVEEDEEAAQRRMKGEAAEDAEKLLAKRQAAHEHTKALRAFMKAKGIRSEKKGEAAFKEVLEAAKKLAERKEAAEAAKAAK